LAQKDAMSTGTNPTVSIILPTYNGHRYLRSSVESCLNQSYPQLEIIIVDDGSTNPQTRAILTDFSDKRIQIIHLKKNGGLPNALNVGFENSSGQLLTWTSDDNLYHKSAIQKMVEEMHKHHVDFVMAPFRTIDEHGTVVQKNDLSPIELLPVVNSIGACFLYSRKVMEKTGKYNTSMQLAEDYDYWVRVSKIFTMHKINQFLYDYRIHSDSLTNTEGSETVKAIADNVRTMHYATNEIKTAKALNNWMHHKDIHSALRVAKYFIKKPWNKRLYSFFLKNGFRISKH
jgi:glycosyltransferase involved in cell wall biosynthesis